MDNTRLARDELLLALVATKQLEAFQVAYRIGQYVAYQKVMLKENTLSEQERAWLEAHIKEHEDWAADCLNMLASERDRRLAGSRHMYKRTPKQTPNPRPGV